MVSIEINGVKEFRDLLKAAPVLANAELRKANYAAAFAIRGKVRQYAPVKTGALRQSIDMVTEGLTTTVKSDLEYAMYLEGGTKGHGPVSAPNLVFQVNGHWVSTKWVKGIKARRFFAQGYEAASRSVQAAYDTALENIVAFLAR